LEPPVADIIPLKSADGKKQPSLEPLVKLVSEDLVKVNEAIIRKMDSRVPLIPQLAGHIIAAGGKRVRPMLTLACARMCGYTGSRQIELAASVEMIHTATLLHDDVVDESDLRRGNDTAHVLWGNSASVLVGDFLFSRAFQLMVGDGSLDVLQVLADASAVISEGEVMQLETSNDITTSEEAYLAVIAAKTAALFAAACKVGGQVAMRPADELDALDSFGRHLGVAFQLVDDALDYSAKQADLGKTVGDDFREGKITLPILLAVRRGDEEEREFWRRCMENLDQNDDDMAHAQALLEKHNALNDTIERARHYGAMARDALGMYPDSAAKSALIETVDFCIHRAY
jgi:octaprenyl-diphosphate synthase